jgi:orotidine-5'-phosphate decarboxylase
MEGSFVERLGNAVLAGGAPACAGLDPRLDALPRSLAPDGSPAERIVAFHREVLPVVARHLPAVKPNIAFFEEHGAAGFGAYETTCRLARELGLLVVGDVKRGDIGSTAAAYARIHLDLADAVTLHPYLGRDAVEPFLERCRTEGKAIFVLVRTSNPGSAAFQDLRTPAGTLAELVADAVDRWGEDSADRHGFASVGAVVGATQADQLRALRARMPRAWLLIPGVGAQGGRIEDLAPAFDGRGLGGLVNQSRGVLQAFEPDDPAWLDRIDRALAAFAAAVREVAVPSGAS